MGKRKQKTKLYHKIYQTIKASKQTIYKSLQEKLNWKPTTIPGSTKCHVTAPANACLLGLELEGMQGDSPSLHPAGLSRQGTTQWPDRCQHWRVCFLIDFFLFLQMCFNGQINMKRTVQTWIRYLSPDSGGEESGRGGRLCTAMVLEPGTEPSLSQRPLCPTMATEGHC